MAGKLAVVTGAGSGIGRETAYALAEQGCELILADIDLDAADETVRECKRFGVTATAYLLDVADTGGSSPSPHRSASGTEWPTSSSTMPASPWPVQLWRQPTSRSTSSWR